MIAKMSWFRLALAIFSVCAPGTRSAGAQEAPAPNPDSVRYTLVPVKIKSPRSPASPLESPVSATKVSGEELRRSDNVGIDKALGLIPGVVAQSRSGGTDVRILIRGFGARGAGDRSNSGTSRGIRVLLDGIPETEPDGRTAFDLIDLASVEEIEVVRSNASALWGNAAGGVVSLSTIPSFENSYTSLQQTLGAFGLARTVLRSGATLASSRLALTVAHTQFDGWREHSEGRRTLVNAALISPITERSELGVFATGATNRYLIPGPLTYAEFVSNPGQANSTYLGRGERRHNRLGRIGATLRHGIGEDDEISTMVFVSPKMLQRSERGTFRDFARYHIGGNAVYRRATSYGKSLPGTLLVGFDEAYQDGAILFYSLSATQGRGDTLRNNQREGAQNAGLFVQQELELSERTRAVLGLRHDAIQYRYEDHLAPELDSRKTFSQLTPKIGLNYRLSPQRSVFASIGGGVEAPAGNETDPAGTYGQDLVTSINPLLDPIRSTTYEVGTKHVFSTRRLGVIAYDAAAYWTDVRNEIVPYRGGRFYFTAGRARRAGVELGSRVQTARGISLQSALTWSDNRYTDYVVDSVHYGRAGSSADYSGNRVVGVPAFTYSAVAGYRSPRLRKVLFQGGVQGNSSYFADDANTIEVPQYAVLSATIAVDEPIALRGGLWARGFVTLNNLWNRSYIASAFLNPDIVGGVPVAFEPGLPRDLQISVVLGWNR
jgi:iron complex outermembrane receptor protein